MKWQFALSRSAAVRHGRMAVAEGVASEHAPGGGGAEALRRRPCDLNRTTDLANTPTRLSACPMTARKQ